MIPSLPDTILEIPIFYSVFASQVIIAGLAVLMFSKFSKRLICYSLSYFCVFFLLSIYGLYLSRNSISYIDFSHLIKPVLPLLSFLLAYKIAETGKFKISALYFKPIAIVFIYSAIIGIIIVYGNGPIDEFLSYLYQREKPILQTRPVGIFYTTYSSGPYSLS